MTKEPLVSVIIPTHNRIKLLIRAIHSVYSQTYKNLEIIVIDDFSSDSTPDVLPQMFPQITYIRNTSSLGNAETRNVGIRSSRGEYVAFLDDDDIWFPDKLEKQMKAFNENPNIHGCFCRSLWVESNKALKDTRAFSESISFEHGGPTSTWLMKREVFDKIGFFDKSFPSAVDGEFLVRFNKSFKSIVLDELLYVHYYYSDQISSNNSKKIAGFKKMIHKHRKVFSTKELAQAQFRLVIFTLFDNKREISTIRKAFFSHPTPKYFILLGILLLPTSFAKHIINIILDRMKYPKSFAGRYKI